MAKKKLILVKDKETGCITPVSHKQNPDGYFRKNIDGRVQMYHVYIWKKHHGEIPEDHEIHHTCGNRACCNIEHLECVEGTAHTIQGNSERYSAREQKACCYWLEHQCTGTVLGEKFGVAFSSGCHGIKGWKGKAQRLSVTGVGCRDILALLNRSAWQRACQPLMI